MTALLALHVACGIVLGIIYFGSLWFNTRLYERAGRLRTLLATMAARFVILGGALTAVSLEGALPLLATALGVLLARVVVLRRVRMVSL